jgi:hypothetical protein
MEHPWNLDVLTRLSLGFHEQSPQEQSRWFPDLFQCCLEAACQLTPLQFRLLAQAAQGLPEVNPVLKSSTLVDFFLEDIEQAMADAVVLREHGYLDVVKADPIHPWYRLTFFGMQVFGVAVFLTATQCPEVR